MCKGVGGTIDPALWREHANLDEVKPGQARKSRPTRRTPALLIKKPFPDLITVQVTPER
jgi:hypothetical protein